MVAQGLNFMFVGMGVVFGFLILMIIVMSISSAIITKYFPEKEEKAVTATASDNKSKIAAVIAIAKAQTS